MTQDQSEQVEELLLSWHRWQSAYFPSLGAPRCSPTFRDCESGKSSLNVIEQAQVADEKIWKRTSETVEVCVDALPKWEHRASIQTSMQNKRCGVTVFSNPRLTAEQSHTYYQEAKELLYPKFVARGLIKIVEVVA
ncbi:MAG TPA: hypothetical protein VMT67_01145 [Terriglobales bacterium]|nr:hypothetical protein [Terriglobales bacterium]